MFYDEQHKIYLPLEFKSGNNTPVERATITKERMVEILNDYVSTMEIKDITPILRRLQKEKT